MGRAKRNVQSAERYASIVDADAVRYSLLHPEIAYFGMTRCTCLWDGLGNRHPGGAEGVCAAHEGRRSVGPRTFATGGNA